MFWKVFVVVALQVFANNVVSADEEWWHSAVIYQVYPRSFKDANNDGFGDIEGVIEKLDFFVETGVTAIWFSPIFPSPMVDAGYDISDFRGINPEFGTLEQFKQLLELAHERGLKILLDLVPNHSSDQHEWFQKSLKGEEPYRDYYVWKNAVNGKKPNDWDSFFGGPTWTWSAERKQYYFHQFDKAQPDLDFRNPKVVQEMKDIMTYWFDLGVDGFRIDAISTLFERADYPNYDQWIHRMDQPETFDMVYQWRELVDNYQKEHGGDAKLLMTESYATYPKLFDYYGNKERKGAHFPFNFWFITDLDVNSSTRTIKHLIDKWLTYTPKGDDANWVLGNHDQHRVGSRFGKWRIDGFAMLTMILPGTVVTYNGEEIGMENGEVKYKEGQDPQGCNAQEENYNWRTRDFERTPYHWDTSVNAGFNDGNATWLPVSKKYLTNNLADQKVKEKSHYSVYKQMVALRKTPTIRYGEYDSFSHNNYVLSVMRYLDGEDTYILVMNVMNRRFTIDLRYLSDSLPETLTVLIPSVQSNKTPGSTVETGALFLDYYEAIVLVVKNEK